MRTKKGRGDNGQKALTWVGSIIGQPHALEPDKCSNLSFPQWMLSRALLEFPVGPSNCSFKYHIFLAWCFSFLKAVAQEGLSPCTHIAGVLLPGCPNGQILKCLQLRSLFSIAHIWSMGNTHPLSNQTKVVQNFPNSAALSQLHHQSGQASSFPREVSVQAMGVCCQHVSPLHVATWSPLLLAKKWRRRIPLS